MISIPFTFTGKVQTIEGEKNVEKWIAITVNENLEEFLEDDDEVTSVKAHEFLFNQQGELGYEECDHYCDKYCSTRAINLLLSYSACLQVIESSNMNVTLEEYLCGCFPTPETVQSSAVTFYDMNP